MSHVGFDAANREMVPSPGELRSGASLPWDTSMSVAIAPRIRAGRFLFGGGTLYAPAQAGDDGTVSVAVGSSSVGQGIETVMAQIAADALEMPMDRLRQVRHGSTALVSQGWGAYGSRSVVMGGSALLDAAEIGGREQHAVVAYLGVRRLGSPTGRVRQPWGSGSALG